MERRRSSNLFCLSVTLAGACPKSISLYNISTVAFDIIIRYSRYLFVAVVYGQKVTKYTENSQTCTDGLFQGLKLLVTHLIQYCMGVQKCTESLVRSQVQIMLDEKTDTFESLSCCLTDRNFSKYITTDNLTPTQTKFR